MESIRILLSTNPNALGLISVIDKLKKFGTIVDILHKKEDIFKFSDDQFDVLISDRTNFIFPSKFIDAHANKLLINSHPSLLPNHRGSRSLFWSVYHNDPFGITIHKINKGVDTGEILYQQKITYTEDCTYREIYDRSRIEILNGFSTILSKVAKSETIESIGNQNIFADLEHKEKDFAGIYELLKNGWDTKIKDSRSLLNLRLRAGRMLEL